MKIILKVDVKNLGTKGDEREVKPGFARNFLLPRGLAVPADSLEAQGILSKVKKEEEKRSNEQESLKNLLDKSQDLTLTFSRKTKGKKLFGSVKPAEIRREIERKIGIAPKKIEPDKPIKVAGEIKVTAVFPQNEKLAVTVRVKAG